MKSKISFAILLTLALFTAAASAQTLDKPKLDAFFDLLAEKNQAMGTLVIAKDGQELYGRTIGYGQINGTEKKPLTAASRFRIASIGKMHTAVMVLQLVEEGKLKLTDTLDKFFPQVTNAKQITILQLLSHRSGIPNVGPAADPQRNWANGITKEDMLALVAKAMPEFAPDAKASYSNSGYFVLALVVEKLTGKTYADALQERIIKKIGLAETYSSAGFIDATKNEALTYVHSGGDWQPVRQTHPSIAYGGGQIISTPHDLAEFIQALFDDKLVSKASLEQMKVIRDDEGLSVVTFTYAGKTFYGATGGGDNYGSWLVYEPQEKLAVAYATNAKIYPVEKIVSGAIDIYYNQLFQIPTFDSLTVSPEILDKYVGIYSSADAPMKWTVTRDGEKLLARPGSEGGVTLEATADNKFQLFGGRVTFEFDAAKNQLTITRAGRPFVLRKDK